MTEARRILAAADHAEADAKALVEKARHRTDKIACPFCGKRLSKVIKPRADKRGRVLRRRRECLNVNCAKRFNTAEKVCA